MNWICVVCKKEIEKNFRGFTVAMGLNRPQHEACYRKTLPKVLKGEPWKPNR